MQSTGASGVFRTNVVGNLATVYVSGGRLDGTRVETAILVGRFSFGWQSLEVLDNGCLLPERGLSARTVALLMRGIPSILGACAYDDGPTADEGSAADVAAIRYRMRGPLVPYVIVSGPFAVGGWYGAGGGETFFKRSGSGWRRIGGSGGATSSEELRRMGVPNTAICAFRTYDAKCPNKHISYNSSPTARP